MKTLILLTSTAFIFAGQPLDGVFQAYDQLHTALAADDLEGAKKAQMALANASESVDAKAMQADVKQAWDMQSKHLGMALKKGQSATDLEGVRASFEHISMAMIAIQKVAKAEGFQEYRCGMAFNNKGANWLQSEETIANPYFGSAMLRCGGKVN